MQTEWLLLTSKNVPLILLARGQNTFLEFWQKGGWPHYMGERKGLYRQELRASIMMLQKIGAEDDWWLVVLWKCFNYITDIHLVNRFKKEVKQMQRHFSWFLQLNTIDVQLYVNCKTHQCNFQKKEKKMPKYETDCPMFLQITVCSCKELPLSSVNINWECLDLAFCTIQKTPLRPTYSRFLRR